LDNSNRKRDLAIVHRDHANADGLELTKELRMTTTITDVPVLAITIKRGADWRGRTLWAGEAIIMAASLEEFVDVAKQPVAE
jgi:PleD family two-component response regulator